MIRVILFLLVNFFCCTNGMRRPSVSSAVHNKITFYLFKNDSSWVHFHFTHWNLFSLHQNLLIIISIKFTGNINVWSRSFIAWLWYNERKFLNHRSWMERIVRIDWVGHGHDHQFDSFSWWLRTFHGLLKLFHRPQLLSFDTVFSADRRRSSP